MARPKLSASLPPLIFGSATFNFQFNPDPFALPTTHLVHHALSLGVRAFDTSPYYGPAEGLLGTALDTDYVHENFSRSSYHLLTKVGRIAADEFDYSPAWIRQSVNRSLRRLRTDYLDVVFCHDVEFVSPEEVLGAVRELRKLRDEDSKIKYIGISGYPVDTLCHLAEVVLRETGEPLDAVMSYANFTLQNTKLLTEGLPRLVAAGVDVVTNASPLGMGLLRHQGVPVGAMGNWHPAPNELREAVQGASDWTHRKGERLETVAIQYALESWLVQGSPAGTCNVQRPSHVTHSPRSTTRQGVSVLGVSRMEELEETLSVWAGVLHDSSPPSATRSSKTVVTDEGASKRREHVRSLASGVRKVIGPYHDFTWDSPSKDFVRRRVSTRRAEKEDQ